MNEELYELENFEGSGFSNFLKAQSKKFIKKAAEKAANTGSTPVGEKLIANKIVGNPKNSSSSSSSSNSLIESKNNSTEIPIDSGYKIIKLLRQQKPESIRTQFNSL